MKIIEDTISLPNMFTIKTVVYLKFVNTVQKILDTNC